MLNTHNYPGISKSEASAKGRDVMENIIKQKIASAKRLIEHVNTVVPSDAVVPAKALRFEPAERGLRIGWYDARGDREVVQPLHLHALGQVTSKARVPSSFITDLAESPEDWRRELAADILAKHYHGKREGEASLDISRKSFLARSVNGELRGFLSDRYRRIDSRPTLEAFAEELQKVGAVPYEGVVSDVRVSLRAIIPLVFEPVEHEIICFGMEWGNSDFGAAKHWARTFILRLWCTNGATLEDALSQVHVGSRLSDDYAFSQQTYDLDTKAQVSALRDVVRGALSPKAIQSNIDLIRSANEREVDWKQMAGALKNRLTKGEQKLAKDAFESADVINLPPGKTAWRMSNALSWIANAEDVDADRKLELQRMAGEVVNGKRDIAASDD